MPVGPKPLSSTPLSINKFAIEKSQKNKLDIDLLIEDAKKILDEK